MKIKATEHGNMCVVRMKDRRIKVWRLHDKSWAVAFVRPAKPCAGCDDEHSCLHEVYTDKKKRMITTGLRLSREGMIGLCDAVAILLEFEQGGVEVRENREGDGAACTTLF